MKLNNRDSETITLKNEEGVVLASTFVSHDVEIINPSLDR